MRKRHCFLFLLILTVLTGIQAEEKKGINLIPVPPRLLQSLPSAVISAYNELPARVNIGSNVMIARSQGRLGSCGSWAVCNELTRLERIRNNWPAGLNRTYFSPLYIYNQVNGGQDRGASLYNNLNILVNKGCATWAIFPYIENYLIQPPVSAHREAALYKIAEFKTLPAIDLDSMRLALAKGFGLIVSFHVYENFDSYSGGIYKASGPSGVYRNGSRFTQHGMLIVGYDDVKRHFLVLNSWGPSWGDQGYLYFSYDDIGSFISECYIMIPKNSLPTEAVPPAHVQAGKGTHKNKVLITWENNGADQYEIFRLGEKERYTSIGKTKNNYFDDTDVKNYQHNFYFVTAHKGEFMSQLSMAAEGWANNQAIEPPGIPMGFTVSRQGNTIIAQWRAVDNADSYQVFVFNETLGEYVLAGEAKGTVFQMPLPSRLNGPVMTFMVLVKNRNGKGLPSEPAALNIEGWKQPNDDAEEHDAEFKDVYRGGFYNFPLRRFRAAERQAMENFRAQKKQAADHFREQRKIFMNRPQN